MNASKTATWVCAFSIAYATTTLASPWTCSLLDRVTENKNYVLDINNIVGQHLDTQDNHISLLNSLSSTAQDHQDATTDVTAHAADNNIIWSLSSHGRTNRHIISIMLIINRATATGLIGICDSRVVGSSGEANDDFYDATWISMGMSGTQTIYSIGATGSSIVGVSENTESSHEPNSSTPEPVDHSLHALGSVTLAR